MIHFFEKLMESERKHASFLNSLSYLEYRGARKIARALGSEDMDPEILKHSHEETRHALYFKALAIKLGGDAFRSYLPTCLFAPDGVKSYFYHLDRIVGQNLTCPRTSYAATTLLVEERALKVYADYEEALAHAKSEFTLKPLIKDEVQHLEHIRSRVPSHAIEVLRGFESELFQTLKQHLERELETRA